MHAVVLRGIQAHRAPAAADVEQAHAGTEAQLAAHELELVALGVLDGVARVVRAPVAARVGQVRVEDQLVELVGEVVVVGDGLAVAPEAVQPATDDRLAGRRGQRQADGTVLGGEPQQRCDRTGGGTDAGETRARGPPAGHG